MHSLFMRAVTYLYIHQGLSHSRMRIIHEG